MPSLPCSAPGRAAVPNNHITWAASCSTPCCDQAVRTTQEPAMGEKLGCFFSVHPCSGPALMTMWPPSLGPQHPFTALCSGPGVAGYSCGWSLGGFLFGSAHTFFQVSAVEPPEWNSLFTISSDAADCAALWRIGFSAVELRTFPTRDFAPHHLLPHRDRSGQQSHQAKGQTLEALLRGPPAPRHPRASPRPPPPPLLPPAAQLRLSLLSYKVFFSCRIFL